LTGLDDAKATCRRGGPMLGEGETRTRGPAAGNHFPGERDEVSVRGFTTSCRHAGGGGDCPKQVCFCGRLTLRWTGIFPDPGRKGPGRVRVRFFFAATKLTGSSPPPNPTREKTYKGPGSFTTGGELTLLQRQQNGGGTGKGKVQKWGASAPGEGPPEFPKPSSLCWGGRWIGSHFTRDTVCGAGRC